MKNIMLFIIIFAIVSSCKRTEIGNNTSIKIEDSILKKMLAKDIDFKWFTAKIKTNYQSPEESMTMTLQVRIEKNKAIWISGQKFNMEGVRVLIKQDSIHVLNRIERTYQVMDFSYIAKEFNLPANFSAVQDFFVGNVLKMSNNAIYNIKEDDNQTILIGVDKHLRATYALNKLNFNLENFLLEDTEAKRQMITKQSDYQIVDKKGNFAYLREIELKSKETSDVSVIMEFSKVEFDTPKDIDFQVPSNYKSIGS